MDKALNPAQLEFLGGLRAYLDSLEPGLVEAARPEDRHRGVTMLITPVDAPGISVTPIITQGGERTNAVFLDGVRIPASQRIGAENGGWAAVTAALNFERMFYHNEPRWELRQLTGWAAAEGLLTVNPA